jgi:hypothetical protein
MAYLYGRMVEETTQPTTLTPVSSPTDAPTLPTNDICSDEFKMDIMVETADGKTYVFSGANFWLVAKAGAGAAI